MINNYGDMERYMHELERKLREAERDRDFFKGNHEFCKDEAAEYMSLWATEKRKNEVLQDRIRDLEDQIAVLEEGLAEYEEPEPSYECPQCGEKKARLTMLNRLIGEMKCPCGYSERGIFAFESVSYGKKLKDDKRHLNHGGGLNL